MYVFLVDRQERRGQQHRTAVLDMQVVQRRLHEIRIAGKAAPSRGSATATQHRLSGEEFRACDSAAAGEARQQSEQSPAHLGAVDFTAAIRVEHKCTS